MIGGGLTEMVFWDKKGRIAEISIYKNLGFRPFMPQIPIFTQNDNITTIYILIKYNLKTFYLIII